MAHQIKCVQESMIARVFICSTDTQWCAYATPQLVRWRQEDPWNSLKPRLNGINESKLWWLYPVSETKVESCPLEPNGKTLLMTAPYALVTSHGEIKLVLTRKVPPYWLTFTVLGSTMKAAVEKIHQQSFLDLNPAEYNNQAKEICPWVIQRHEHYGSNRLLSDWT